MSAVSDDSLFSPAVAPVTRSYAVVAKVDKEHAWMQRGTVVQVSDFLLGDSLKDSKAVTKAERAGHTLKRLLCPMCTNVTGYEKVDGVVGVLAEAVDVGKANMKLHGGFVTITIAIENAAEVYVPPPSDMPTVAHDIIKIGWTSNLKSKVPSQTITLQARKDLGRFRVATVLAPWTLGDAVGIHACLHPQIFVTEPTLDELEKQGLIVTQRILVTGGAGFLGSHLCRRLLQDNNDVLCVDNYFTGSKENISDLTAHPNFTVMACRHGLFIIWLICLLAWLL